MASRAETTRDQWVTALALITTANGYNNTVQGVSKAFLTEEDASSILFPYIALELGDSTIKFHDSAWTINDELIPFYVAGYVKVDTETSPKQTATKVLTAMQSLIHDIAKKICTDLLTVNANHATNPWVVSMEKRELTFRRIPMLGTARNIGMIWTELTVRIKNQNVSFTAN